MWLKKVWLKIKKYWKALLIALSSLVGLFLFKRRGDYFRELIQKNNEAHKAELTTLEESREKERIALEAAKKKHEETLAQIEGEFALRGEELTSKKRAEVKKLVEKHADDSEALTRMLADTLGVDVFSISENDRND